MRTTPAPQAALELLAPAAPLLPGSSRGRRAPAELSQPRRSACAPSHLLLLHLPFAVGSAERLDISLTRHLCCTTLCLICNCSAVPWSQPGFGPHTGGPTGACDQPVPISGPQSCSFSTCLSSTHGALAPAICSHCPSSAKATHSQVSTW